MTVDWVIKSYPPDFPWLHYALRSIQKFATGFRRVIVIVPPGHGLQLTNEFIREVPGPENYLTQQIAKLNADYHTKADFLVFVDSDTILIKPVTPATFIKDGKAIWYMTPWNACAIEERRAWLHVMTRCLVECPPAEFMRKIPVCVPRFALAEFRDFILRTHGVTMDAYVANCPGREFSEWNTLGFFLWLYHREKVHWHDTTVDGLPDKFEDQAWSWGGLTPEIKERFERALS